MIPYQDPNAAAIGDPASRISINNPLRDASRGKVDPWLLARSEDMTRKLSALQKEYADYQSEVADKAEILWDEMELDKAERLGRRLHSKKPGPVTSALRLTLEGTKLLEPIRKDFPGNLRNQPTHRYLNFGISVHGDKRRSIVPMQVIWIIAALELGYRS